MRHLEFLRARYAWCFASLVLGSVVAQAPLTWVPKYLPHRPLSLAMATDTVRNRIVLFADSETWEWDGFSWTKRFTANTPPYRGQHAMAYDSVRQRVVLFGGTDGSIGLHDTWEFDGMNWHERTPAVSPPGRWFHGLVYDVSRQRTVMYGGLAGAYFDDTWEWDGMTWTKSLGPGPGAGGGSMMSYDAARSEVVLFGSVAASLQTWVRRDAVWTLVAPTVSPPARSEGAFAFDSTRNRVVLFGGYDGSFPLRRDTWEWDGANWSEIPTTSPPPGEPALDFAYDPSARALILLGGGYSGSVDHWVWDGVAWAHRVLPSDIQPCVWKAMAYDRARRRTVLISDFFGCNVTWEWDGRSWIAATEKNPFCLAFHAIAYDERRARTVLFGGVGGVVLNSTFEWDGVAWSLRRPREHPPARQRHALVYDASRGRVLLFGGTTTLSSPVFNDTWEYDGETWTKRFPEQSPPPRYEHGMAYDAGRRRAVVFGGYSSGNQWLDDTWEWDGVTWTQSTPTIKPTARSDHAMAYDERRGRVVLFGGLSVPGTLFDTWEWDGAAWTPVPVAAQPTGNTFHHAMAYDASRGQMVMTPGGSPTWLLERAIVASTAMYGAGCGGAAGVPVLDVLGRAVAGNHSFALDVYASSGGTPLAYLVAAAPANLPLGPCTLLVDPTTAVALPGATNSGGFASLRIPIPSGSELQGIHVYSQVVVLDATAPAGFGGTRGVDIAFGE